VDVARRRVGIDGMMAMRRLSFFAVLTSLLTGLSAPAWADGARNWGLGFQDPATPVMAQIKDFHDLLLIIITLITLFVLGLLIYVMFRFSEKRNPTPSKTTHNTLIEVLWTVIPIVILVFIAIPSFKLLYFTDVAEDADLTVKAIGKQWYWSYEYPDNGNFTFDAFPLDDEDAPEGARLLATDNPLVLPVDTRIRFIVTAGDVLHNFAVPAFGIKMDGVPGRLNETWAMVPAEHTGKTFYGQCSELCGTGHSYMPIEIRLVSKEDYAEWVKTAQEEFARVDDPANRVRVAEVEEAE